MDKSVSFDIQDDELEIFLEDVNEHIAAMESGVLSMEKAAGPETLNAVFRAVHCSLTRGRALAPGPAR